MKLSIEHYQVNLQMEKCMRLCANLVTSQCTMNVPLSLHEFHYRNMVWIFSVAQLSTYVHAYHVAVIHPIYKQFHLTSLVTITV